MASLTRLRARFSLPFRYKSLASTEHGLQIYRKLSLDSEKHQILLLELYPGDHEDDLAGRLFVVSLDDGPIYSALSYVWGDPSPVASILINKKFRLPLASNLHNALKDLRYSSESIIIWTDALCIDQTNKAELAHQVANMRHIYANAGTVRVWIDHDIDPSCQILQQCPNIQNGSLDDVKPEDVHFWSPVVDLLSNPYWQRLWIQQELFLAHSIQINCRKTMLTSVVTGWLLTVVSDMSTRFHDYGDARFSWLNEVINLDPFFGGFPIGKEALAGREECQRALPAVRIYTGNFAFGCLLSLFLGASSLKTSQPRDQVFGLLGLAIDFEPGDINIDYTLSVRCVHRQVLEMFIRKHRSLMFLCHSIHTFEANDQPLWFPSPKNHNRILWTSILASASFQSPLASYEAHGAVILSEGLVLSARGVRVDTISWLSPKSSLSAGSVLELCKQLATFCSLKKPCTDGSDSLLDEGTIAVLFPWISDQNSDFRRMRKIEPAERPHVVRRLFEVALSPQVPSFSLDNVSTNDIDLSHLVSSQELESFKVLRAGLGGAMFLGTSRGRLGVMFYDQPVELGDEIWYLYGCPLPILLRPRGGGKDGYIWAGCPTNIPGLMMGEELEGFPDNAEVGFKKGGREIRQIDIW